MHAGKTNGYSV